MIIRRVHTGKDQQCQGWCLVSKTLGKPGSQGTDCALAQEETHLISLYLLVNKLLPM